MEWGEYYKKFDEWATSTQISRLSALTSYGPSDEVAEVAQGLMDETAASRLVRRALAAGVQFTAEEICELVNCCNAAVMNALLENSTCAFTREQLEDIWGVVDDAVLEQTVRRCRVKLFDDDEEEEEEEDDEPEQAELSPPKRSAAVRHAGGGYSMPRICFSHFHAAASVWSSERSAFQPSSSLAYDGSAQIATMSPARRPTIL